jgi:hypothetical protein
LEIEVSLFLHLFKDFRTNFSPLARLHLDLSLICSYLMNRFDNAVAQENEMGEVRKEVQSISPWLLEALWVIWDGEERQTDLKSRPIHNFLHSL